MNIHGNGAGMRISICGIFGQSLDEVTHLTRQVTGVSHNHPEGIKAGEALSIAVYLARQK